MPKKRLTLDVTQADLEGGIRGDSSRCAVARAIARQVAGGKVREVEVDTATVRWTDEDGRWWFPTPITVAQYVSDYDLGVPLGPEMIAGQVLGPFRFTLRDPIKAPKRRRTELGHARQQAYDDALRAIREHHGLTRTRWLHLGREGRREKVRAAFEAGVETGPVGLRMGLEDRGRHAETNVTPGPTSSTWEAGRAIPPKVFRSHRRTYGGRLLRWNRPPETAAGGAVV